MFQKRATLLGSFIGMLIVGAVVTAGDNDTVLVWSSNGTVHKVLGAGWALGELVECTTRYRFTVCEKV